jgi:hypothetical protein
MRARIPLLSFALLLVAGCGGRLLEFAGTDGGTFVFDSGVETGPPATEAGRAEMDAESALDAVTIDAGALLDGPDATSVASGGYRVVGPTIYDGAGNAHLFHGVDRPSLEWSSTGEYDNANGIPASDFQTMASWHANVVRLSLNQDFWLSGAALYDPNYAATVRQAVTNAEAAGLDVILDLHWSDCGNLGVTALSGMFPPDTVTVSGQQVMGDANSVSFWAEVANAYQADVHVLFELYNEPNTIPPIEWVGGGNSTGCPTVGMQALYNAVRDTGAQNLVVIGGLNYAFDLSMVPSYPVRGTNIVYATNPYNFPGKDPTTWAAAFGFLTASAPVMATEFGDTSVACDTTYYSELIAYANQSGGVVGPAYPMSWSGWGWFVSGCSFPSLIGDWSGTPTAAGAVEKAALLAY